MSLRYRLFLWVSGLFVVISICAYFTENYVTQHELTKAQKSFTQEILASSEKRRLDLQNFLTTSIAEEAIRLDAILNNISSFFLRRRCALVPRAPMRRMGRGGMLPICCSNTSGSILFRTRMRGKQLRL